MLHSLKHTSGCDMIHVLYNKTTLETKHTKNVTRKGKCSFSTSRTSGFSIIIGIIITYCFSCSLHVFKGGGGGDIL